ncbi:MAG: 2-hydroxyacid dehydrogenase [Spirochaetales bacterium]
MTVLWRYHLAHEFPDEIEALRADFPETRQIVSSDTSEFRSALPEADIVVSAPMTEEDHRSASAMKAHFLPYAGTDRLPLQEYADRGITVANSHGNAAVVAERALALALAAAGRVVEFHNQLKEGLWARRANDPAQVFEYWRSLQGARCVSVGVGRIGSRIAELMSGFNCHFTGVARPSTRSQNGSRRTAPFHAIETDLLKALQGADIVFLALPLTAETNGLVGPEALQAMDGAILVNVSRGEIVQEEALFRALSRRSATRYDEEYRSESGPVAAGIDCWWVYPETFEEPRLPSRLPFHRLPNVVISPHAASHTREGKRGQMAETIENVRSYLETGIPRHRVDLTAGY